jgi:hypothetical protein
MLCFELCAGSRQRDAPTSCATVSPPKNRDQPVIVQFDGDSASYRTPVFSVIFEGSSSSRRVRRLVVETSRRPIELREGPPDAPR